MLAATNPVDLIEELRLRRWARENHVASDERDAEWHPLVHEEMQQMDLERLVPQSVGRVAGIVPLEDGQVMVHTAHAATQPHGLRVVAEETSEMYYN